MKEPYKKFCREGASPSIIINVQKNLTIGQQLDVLVRLKTAVENEPLRAIDSNTIGDKYTHCNWGMCTDSKEVYHENRMHIFPASFDDDGRISALSPVEGTDCPMRKRNPDDSESVSISGCFYQCRIFNRKLKTPTKDETIALIDEKIRELV